MELLYSQGDEMKKSIVFYIPVYVVTFSFRNRNRASLHLASMNKCMLVVFLQTVAIEESWVENEDNLKIINFLDIIHRPNVIKNDSSP